MIDVFQEAERVGHAGEPAALVTVIRVAGSAPRKPGAKMIVHARGSTVGSVGGGRIEWEAIGRARSVARREEPAVRIRKHLTQELGMCCGGEMELWVEPLDAARWRPMVEAARHRRMRTPVALATSLDGSGRDAKVLLSEDECLRTRRPRLEDDRFVEPILPADRLVLFGAGHVALAVAPIAASVGFEVVVCDEDERFASTERFPGTRLVHGFDVDEVARELGAFGPGDFVVIATREHAIDQAVLEGLLDSPALTYLGLIGSEGKRGRFRQRILAKGVHDEAAFARVHTPVGLDIGAETPAEIAVSIVAALVAVRAGEA